MPPFSRNPAMETQGVLEPASVAEATAVYEDCGPVAQEVVREVVIAMGADREEYEARVTADVVETARDAIFAGMLAVHTDTLEAFEAWRADLPADWTVHVEGTEHVAHAAWHVAPAFEQAVAATYEKERRAAISTLRRIAWGRIYREELAPRE